MGLKYYLMLNFSQNNIACVATVIMSRTATINKYYCNNKINKTTTTNK